jgi:hypothetical protein
MVIRDLARDPWLWPWSTALRLAAATLDSFEEFLSSGHSDARPLEPAWTTSRQTLLDLLASRVHDFVGGAGFPIILVPRSRSMDQCWPIWHSVTALWSGSSRTG